MSEWECPFCGRRRHSPNGTGGDIDCCGEIGHCNEVCPKCDSGCTQTRLGDIAGQKYLYTRCDECEHEWRHD